MIKVLPPTGPGPLTGRERVPAVAGSAIAGRLHLSAAIGTTGWRNRVQAARHHGRL